MKRIVLALGACLIGVGCAHVSHQCDCCAPVETCEVPAGILPGDCQPLQEYLINPAPPLPTDDFTPAPNTLAPPPPEN